MLGTCRQAADLRLAYAISKRSHLFINFDEHRQTQALNQVASYACNTKLTLSVVQQYSRLTFNEQNLEVFNNDKFSRILHLRVRDCGFSVPSARELIMPRL